MPSQTENEPQENQHPDDEQSPPLPAHPHDRVWKFLMRFREFYIPFFYRYLPQELQERAELSLLEHVPSTFPHPRHMRASDCVFRCPLKNNDGWLYIVVECQATNDTLMDYRVQKIQKLCVSVPHRNVRKNGPTPSSDCFCRRLYGPSNL